MKIAVISDVHGNFTSLQAVLDDIEKERPDQIVCAGDMVCSAYPGSLQVWQTLKPRRIPTVLGNNDDYVVAFHSSERNHVTSSIRMMPVRHWAKQFSQSDIADLANLPMCITIKAPDDNSVLICHASPRSLTRSIAHIGNTWPNPQPQGVDAEMLRDVDANVIVAGHLHITWHANWQNKLAILVGSAGLPLKGKLGEVEYLLLVYTRGKWRWEHKSVRYDHDAGVRSILASDFLDGSGPIGWLMLDEALTQRDHLATFLHTYCPSPEPESLGKWEELVRSYLQSKGRWEQVKAYLPYLQKQMQGKH